MKILLLGASGGVGARLGAMAASEGHAVTALVRNATGYAAPAGVRVLRGEVLDEVVLDEAMAGAEAVLSCLGLKRRDPANPWSALATPADFGERAAASIVASMKRHGVRRVVAVSAAGVADSAPRMNLAMRVLVATSSIGVAYRGLARMEEIYSASGLDWLAPRPTRLTDGPRTGRVRVVDAFGSLDAISRADVAGWMLAALAATEWPAPAWGDRTPQITRG